MGPKLFFLLRADRVPGRGEENGKSKCTECLREAEPHVGSLASSRMSHTMITKITLFLIALFSFGCADQEVGSGSKTSAAIGFDSLALDDEVHTIEHLSYDRGLLDAADTPCILAVFANKEAQLFLPLSEHTPTGEAIPFCGGDMFISERINVREFEQGETLSISAKLESGAAELHLAAQLNLRDCR